MSTLEAREQLIQRRQAEKYVNVIRLILLVFLTAAWLVQTLGLPAPSNFLRNFPSWLLTATWAYALIVQWSLSRGFFPRYLSWLTTTFDLTFIAAGFGVELAFSSHDFAIISTNLSWGHALLFLFILFSALRERPSITLFTGISSAAIYGIALVLTHPQDPPAGYWTDQSFRLGLLLLAGFFSSFLARSNRKAFQRAADSDRRRRETDARLKVLAQHFPGVLFQVEILKRRFKVVYVSEGSRELLGLDPHEVAADPRLFLSLAPPELLKSLRSRLDWTTGVTHRWEEEFLYQPQERPETWLKMNVTSHLERNERIVLNGLLSDVTQQRIAQDALRQANEAKTDFLATMSHELRTPLNAILGNTDHLSRLAADDDDLHAFRDVQASAETLLGMIEDILVFSRLESGRLRAEVRPFSWRPQLDHWVATYRPQALAKRLRLTVQYPPNAPTTIGTDSLRLRQIVGNLLSNAIKFTPAGEVGIELSIDDTEKGPWLQVIVSDTGIGIPLDSQERVFEKFTQGEHGKSRSYGGLGLGLSISRSLTELLGGTLEVQSQPGVGSRFTLRVPVRTPESAPSESGTFSPDPVIAPIRVLLVEDNVSNQDVATRMLRRLNIEVDVVSNGQDAVDAAAKTFYDLIFMDWQMPGMDGREATARIREHPDGADLVIVALSGHALPGDREFLLASGFDDYLSKPVRLDDFRVTLAKWIKSPPNPK